MQESRVKGVCLPRRAEARHTRNRKKSPAAYEPDCQRLQHGGGLYLMKPGRPWLDSPWMWLSDCKKRLLFNMQRLFEADFAARFFVIQFNKNI